jgi:hypothetical protein
LVTDKPSPDISLSIYGRSTAAPTADRLKSHFDGVKVTDIDTKFLLTLRESARSSRRVLARPYRRRRSKKIDIPPNSSSDTQNTSNERLPAGRVRNFVHDRPLVGSMVAHLSCMKSGAYFQPEV